MNPVSGERAPTAIISRSESSRVPIETLGRCSASSAARWPPSLSRIRSTSVPPCGAIVSVVLIRKAPSFRGWQEQGGPAAWLTGPPSIPAAPDRSLRYTSRIRHPVPPPRSRSMQTLLGDDLVRELNARFESSPPNEIIRWALESGLERMAVATAFQAEGTAIIHMAVNVRPEVPVL